MGYCDGIGSMKESSFHILQPCFSPQSTQQSGPRVLRTLSGFAGIITLTLTSFTPVLARQHEDYLVVEKVRHLLVYNKYQQEPTRLERGDLAPYVPIRIITKSDVLSDGFTPCMKVDINGNIFYLVQEKDGHLVGSKTAGFNKVYENAIPVHDSIQILTPRTIQFSDPLHSETSPLLKGEKILRIFLHNGQPYAMRPGRTPTYGWLALDKTRENRDWKVITRADRTPDVIPDRIVQNIKAKIDETNQLLSHLFGYFNNKTHQHLPPPSWEMSTSPDAISCVLRNSPPDQDFAASTRYLSKDLENSVLGSGLRIVSEPGRIEIRKN